MTGWYRQQMVKLHIPTMLGFGGYLTLDSDVCCVGDFDARTFVETAGRCRAGSPSTITIGGKVPPRSWACPTMPARTACR